ncbi:MAG: sigma-70 family RNA polymerase sigma factor [Candidatus Aminicenantes bacterium]|nr:sigma-70 family RNA polymerase sigma factor [Candidatus Aminicenantes bacterium]
MTDPNLTVSDEELVRKTRAGSRRSFEILVDRYSPRLFHFLRPKISSDQDIEDIIQETFFKIYRNIFRYNSKWKVSTWIYTAAYRLSVSHFRSQKNRAVRHRIQEDELTPEEKYFKQIKRQNIWKQAKHLKPDHYRVLWLRYAEDLSSKEIAKIMRRTDLAVRLLLYRARLNLAELLQKKKDFQKNEASSALEWSTVRYEENKG